MKLILLVIFLAVCCPSIADDEYITTRKIDDLQYEGTLIRLHGDFEAAQKIEDALIENYTEPAGHVFALNTIITHLTWDERDTSYNEALLEHAEATIDWCTARIEDDPRSVLGHYYCGQAHFALSYYYGLTGSYYSAGRYGTRTIEYLEEALRLDPSLTDAKMHLGVAYFVADNLPPFVKMFSRVLWFIPTGNSEKSLPYLQEVIAEGFQYQDVARYIYSVLLLEGGDDELNLAIAQLTHLVASYPANPRFQIRLISLLLIEGYYEKTLEVANGFLGQDTVLEPEEVTLTRVWMTRAHMGLNQVEKAAALFDELDASFMELADELPEWSMTWHLLTKGQLHDLAKRRDEAKAAYRDILDIAASTYVNQLVIDAATTGLSQPYTLGN